MTKLEIAENAYSYKLKKFHAVAKRCGLENLPPNLQVVFREVVAAERELKNEITKKRRESLPPPLPNKTIPAKSVLSRTGIDDSF